MKARRFLGILLAFALFMGLSIPALADTSQDVTVTATPSFIAIANAPGAWTINDVADATGKVIALDTLYYSNPLGDTTIPTVGGAVDGECRFTITNTSTVITDLTVLFPDHTGGDASANSETGENGAATFGAKSYFSGQLQAAWVIAKDTGSAAGLEDLAATTNIKWGLIYESQSGAWTSPDAMSSTVTITATAA